MSERLEGRVVVVTGASRGIALVTARLLAERGPRVALLARDEQRLAAARVHFLEIRSARPTPRPPQSG
jgi:short-subunit dehydrogenase